MDELEDNKGKKKSINPKSIIDDWVGRFSSHFKLNITFKLTFSNVLVLLFLLIICILVLKNAFFYMRYLDQEENLSNIASSVTKNLVSYRDLQKDEFKNKVQLYDIDYSVENSLGERIFITNTTKKFNENIKFNWISPATIDLPECVTYQTTLTLEEGEYKVTFFKSVIPSNITTSRFILAFLGVVAVLLVLYSLWSSKITQSTLLPIEAMTNTVKMISATDMSGRLDVKGAKDELRDLAQTFNKMMDNIEIAYEKQNQFVSDASHELRTPISIIRGYADMLERWGKKDPQILEESIEAIKEESINMQQLVEKLLFFVRNEKNALEIRPEKVKPDEIIESLLHDFVLVDKSHSYEGKLNYGKSLVVDRQMLIQLVRIFVDNSKKYTPAGGQISVSTYSKVEEKSIGAKERFVLEIRDNGLGIAKENLDRIFDRFFKVDESRTRVDNGKETGGSIESKGNVKSFGLGLSIARVIVDAHNGYIEVESEENKGSVFRVIM